MSLAAGDLTRKVLIEKPTDAVDAANQSLDLWERHAEPWARPLGQTGMATIKGEQQGVDAAINRYSWRIRYNRTITTDMRLVEDGLIHSIVAVKHDLDRRDWTDIVCEQGGNRG